MAIVGPTNAGKSSLLNTLIGDDRAIVSDIHGTTRDTIQETITMGDYQFRFIDTAGIRETTDTIEQQGVKRSLAAISNADIIITLNDITQPLDSDIASQIDAIVANRGDNPPCVINCLNKSDLIDSSPEPTTTDTIIISTKTKAGIDNLTSRLIDATSALRPTSKPPI